MTRKVTVQFTVTATVLMDEGVQLADVVNEMDYSVNSQTTGATVEDTQIVNFEVTDSR